MKQSVGPMTQQWNSIMDENRRYHGDVSHGGHDRGQSRSGIKERRGKKGRYIGREWRCVLTRRPRCVQPSEAAEMRFLSHLGGARKEWRAGTIRV